MVWANPTCMCVAQVYCKLATCSYVKMLPSNKLASGVSMSLCQRVANWGPNWACFYMLFGLYAPQLASSKSYIIWILSIDVTFGACHLWGVCLICCGVQAIFYHKFFIPDHPLHQYGIFSEVVDGAKVLKMFLFRCKLCLNNITRCFMQFEAKWTTPVVWAEIQFKFWHWMFTYWATTLYLGPLFTPKHDRSISFMIRNRLTCWKPDLVDFGFPPFLAPLLLIFSKGNGPKWDTWPTTAPFRPIFVAMIFFIEM